MRVFKSMIICLGVILTAGLQVEAQFNNTLYFMHGVPQSNRINPAHQPNCGVYIGLPSLSPVMTQTSSSSLAYGDVIYPHPTADSLITVFHPLGDKEAFLGKLKPLNYVLSDEGTSLFSLGFRTGAGFFTLDLTTRVNGGIYYPGDLARLVFEGAGDEELYTLDGIGPEVSGFNEVSLGWSGAIGQRWQIGVRGKLLFGLGNLTTTKSELSVATSAEVWHISSDMLFNASLPFGELVYDEDGMVEDIIFDEELLNLNPWELARYAFNKRNMGAGIDLGVNFRPSKRWLLSASLLDLGFISWKDNVHQVSHNIEYDYTGVEVNPFEFTEDNTLGDYLDSSLTEILDTLGGALEFTPGQVYKSRLNSILYLGASWYVTPNINFGLLARTDFLKNTIVEQVTASANFTTGRLLNFTLSYSYINSYFKNLGAGISLNAGPFNLYVISDNAISSVFWPQEEKTANVWVGMNLVFGYREKEDRPLLY
jgi:hypothetical protein